MTSTLFNSNEEQELSKHSELDLIPTKITSVEPDPVLFVTPEKRTLLKLNKNTSNELPSFIKQGISSNLPSLDTDLLVTPEKPRTVLKSNLKDFDRNQTNKVVCKNKVRFDVPDSSDDTTAESLSPGQTYNEGSSLSTDLDEETFQTDEGISDFSMKAALYTRRNPLEDITIGSNQSFDSSGTSTGTSDGLSTVSSQQLSSDMSDMQKSFSTILDMKGKRFVKKDPCKATIDPIKPNTKTRITVAGKSKGHRKKTPVQTRIDKLTLATQANVVASLQPEKDSIKSSTFLKKKSGLQRHQHSIKYMSKADQNKVGSNELQDPQYNSSVGIGQKLQAIKEQDFDAMGEVTKRLQTDVELKKHVSVKASEATNIDPEEILYNNLISVAASATDVVKVPELRRIKRPPPPKLPCTDEPNIMDAFPDDLIQEEIILDTSCYSLPKLKPVQAPLDGVMSLYNHSLYWK